MSTGAETTLESSQFYQEVQQRKQIEDGIVVAQLPQIRDNLRIDRVPNGWGQAQLQWRKRFLTDDYDREEWLFAKYFADCNLQETDDPHNVNNIKILIEYLEKKHEARVRKSNCGKWFFRECARRVTCYGLLLRYHNSGIAKCWWVIQYMFGYFWILFLTHTFKKLVYNIDDDAYSLWDDFFATLTISAVLSAAVMILFETPRIWNHAPLLGCCHRNKENKKEYFKSNCSPCARLLLDGFENRIKRQRLQHIIGYDQTLDSEASTYHFDYDPDDEDPDEFVYLRHFREMELHGSVVVVDPEAQTEKRKAGGGGVYSSSRTKKSTTTKSSSSSSSRTKAQKGS